MTRSDERSAHQVKSLVLIDDHPIVRQGIVQLLAARSNLEVVGQCESARDALRFLGEQPVDLAMVDVRLGEEDGLELVRQIRGQWPDMRILVLSMHEERLYAPRALRAGADGYIMKSEDPEVLMHAIDQILAGHRYVSPQVQDDLLRNVSAGQEALAVDGSLLSDRELAVFERLGEGVSSREIAESLHLSVKTVQTYRERIKEKLGLKSSAELIHRAHVWNQQKGQSAP